MRNDEHGFFANRVEDLKGDFPGSVPMPTRTIDEGERLDLNGIPVELHLIRATVAIEAAVLYLPEQRVLLAADLVNNKTTPVFYQGGIDAWVGELEALKARFPDAETLCPGHGQPGPFAELIDAELDYLRTFRTLVEDELWRERRMTPDGRRRIARATAEKYPDWRTSAGVPMRAQLIDLNIGWVLRGWRTQEAGASSPREFRPPTQRPTAD